MLGQVVAKFALERFNLLNLCAGEFLTISDFLCIVDQYWHLFALENRKDCIKALASLALVIEIN